MSVSVGKKVHSDVRWGDCSYRWGECPCRWEAVSFVEHLVSAACTLGLDDSHHFALVKALSESSSLSERASKESAVCFADSFSGADKRTIHLGKTCKESTSTTDKLAKGIGQNPIESLRASDGFSRVFTVSRVFNEEGIGIGLDVRKWIVTEKKESPISVSQSLKKATEKPFDQQVAIGEYETDPGIHIRDFYENIILSERVTKTLLKNFQEKPLSIAEDTLYPYLPGILNDISIDKVPIMKAGGVKELAEDTTPYGFSNWKHFVSGDYEYQEALFKLVLDNPAPESIKHVSVTKHNVVCDVADRNERGQNTIGESEQKVKFAKQFAEPPVVNITSMHGANFVVPQIISVDRDGFTVVLKDPMTGENAHGAIHWQAFGY